MRKMLSIAGIGLALAFAPGTGLAEEATKADCVLSQLSVNYRGEVAATLLGSEDAKILEPYYARLKPIVTQCAIDQGVSDADREQYAQFVIARILRDWTRAELMVEGVSTDPIDSALDFRPSGRVLVSEDGISDDQFDKLAAAYAATGADFSELSMEVADLIGQYVGASGMYWTLEQKFRP